MENLDLFDFAPGAHSPVEYGKYMIQQSGHFDYDENLDEFYDYEGYAVQRMNERTEYLQAEAISPTRAISV